MRVEAPASREAPAVERLEILDGDGAVREGAEAPLTDEEILQALRWMKLSRLIDDRAFSLQRQGRMGTYAPVRGQEATVVGSSLALDPAMDWIVPQYRDLVALVRHGWPLDQQMLYWMGNPAGCRLPEGVKVLPVQIALAAHLPHAAGLAWGLKLQHRDGIVMSYFGDGASSEGDSHEALNLAGVTGSPVVFVLQNNGWAISTPRVKQSAAETLAYRARGYGFPGIVVDGNDLFAVHQAARTAAQRARDGEGPTLIEAQTYRMGAHNTADDPTRYMDDTALEDWRSRDPILRVERYLAARGLWSDEAEEQLRQELEEEVDTAIAVAESFDPPHIDQIFDHVYADPPARMRQQYERAREVLGASDA